MHDRDLLDKPEAKNTQVENNTDNSATDDKMPLWKNEWVIVGIAGAIVLFFMMLFLLSGKNKPAPTTNTPEPSQKAVAMVPTFGGGQESKNIENAINEHAQKSLSDQNSKVLALQSQLNDVKSQLNDQNSALKKQLENMQSNKSGYSAANNSADPAPIFTEPHPAQPISGKTTAQFAAVAPIQDFALSYNTPNSIGAAELDYVPAGTFVRAILMGGADANAAVGSQGNTTPILFKILDNGTEPNLKKAHLKNCFITGQTYGDISSERALVRLDRLSCNYPDGSVLDIPVYGTAYDIGGKNGIRGIEVMRNGKILTISGVAGFMQGFANALQNAQTTQNQNELGTTTSTVSPGSSFKYAALGGGSTAMNNLANYYIQLAEQYHPIIQINAGAYVDIIFTQGFSTSPSQTNTSPRPIKKDESATNPYGFASPPQTQSWQTPSVSLPVGNLTAPLAQPSAL